MNARLLSSWWPYGLSLVGFLLAIALGVFAIIRMGQWADATDRANCVTLCGDAGIHELGTFGGCTCNPR